MRAILKSGPHAYERIVTTREDAVARFAAEGETYKVEIAEEPARGRAGHVLRAGRLHRPLPRPAPADDQADQGLQAHVARGRLLARRLRQADAHAHLRHGLLRPGRPRRAPRAHRGGAAARSPPPRPRARPLPPQRDLAGLAVLAPARHGALQRARPPLARAQREPRLRGGQDADPLRHRALEALRALGQLPRQDVPDRAGRGPAVRPQADELPGARRDLQPPAALLPRPAAAARRAGPRAPQRGLGLDARPPARAPHHAGRRAHLLPLGSGRGRGRRLPRPRERDLRDVRARRPRRALDPAREAPRQRGGVGSHGGRAGLRAHDGRLGLRR